MNYPFRVSGRTVEVYRFQVDYTEELPGENDELEQVAAVQYCPTQEEADAVAEQTGGTVTALNTTAYEWLDGLTLPDVWDTYGEAVKVYEMGEAAYEAALSEPDELTMTQLAVAELAQAQEDNNTAAQLAIAELAEALLGGNT